MSYQDDLKYYQECVAMTHDFGVVYVERVRDSGEWQCVRENGDTISLKKSDFDLTLHPSYGWTHSWYIERMPSRNTKRLPNAHSARKATINYDRTLRLTHCSCVELYPLFDESRDISLREAVSLCSVPVPMQTLSPCERGAMCIRMVYRADGTHGMELWYHTTYLGVINNGKFEGVNDEVRIRIEQMLRGE